MRNKEDIIRDQRTVEAVRNGLMSGTGKIGVIARVLGDRVAGRHGDNHGSSPVFENLFAFDQNFMEEDPFEDDGDLPIIEDGERHTASLFNGYRRGLHLEIRYDRPELWVRWKGEIVYHEMGGELYAYCPGEWEPIIDKLSLEARRKERDYIEISDKRDEIRGQRNKEAFLDEIKKKWGI